MTHAVEPGMHGGAETVSRPAGAHESVAKNLLLFFAGPFIGPAGSAAPGDSPAHLRLLPFRRRWAPYVVLAVAAATLYANTLRHGYALDDGIVINRNRHVLAGLGGIPAILGSDSYQSYYEQMAGLSRLPGGRYRPLSLVSFALEQELVGAGNDADRLARGAALRHFDNVALYLASVLLLYLLLSRHLLRRHPDAAFLAAFLFCIHPVHTEVVANVKSRDEILSLLFITLALIGVCRYLETRRVRHLAGVAAATLLAVFSKEYAFALLAVVPATVFLSILSPHDLRDSRECSSLSEGRGASQEGMGFRRCGAQGKAANVLRASGPRYGERRPLRRHLGLVLAVLAPLALFGAVRLAVLPPGGGAPPADVLSDPYLLATASQEAGTKLVVGSKYLGLLFFPAVLSSDYSYRSIPYREFLGAASLCSLALFASLALLAARLVHRKHPAAWGAVFFFACLLLVANVFFDVGAAMGERLVYHASLGWAVCVAWACTAGVARLTPDPARQRALLLAGLAVVTALCGWRTVTRNRDWKNDATLALHDVTVMPESVLLLGNAGARWIDLADQPAGRGRREELLRKAIGHLDRAMAIYPDFLHGHLSLGLARFKLGEYEQAERSWRAAARIHPGSPYLVTYFGALAGVFAREGAKEAGAQRYREAVRWYERAAALQPRDARLWYDLGRTALFLGDCALARTAFGRCLQLAPEHRQARNGLARCP
ncbi:MAG TPA: tetratricopeptide repeat protein [Candidatus Methanoperedens sp.]|nr:tetratricopeptide repeat protein [Candidatus Methanoperedens sp.]